MTEERKATASEVLELALRVGYHLQMNGAEIYRIEESVHRVINAYGYIGDAFAIPNVIIVTVSPEGEVPLTRMRRIGPHSVNIDGIERLYGVCRKICTERPPISQAMSLVTEEKRHIWTYSTGMYLGGCWLVAAAFALFFGSGLVDSVFAGCCGVLVGQFLSWMTRLRVNVFFKTLTASFILACVTQTLFHFSLIQHPDSAAIGALMLLVPGMTFTDSMRDIIYGDTLSGINKLVQVVLIAAALLLGTGVAIQFSAFLWNTNFVAGSIPVQYPAWVLCLAAGLSCAGFCVVYQQPIKGIPFCMGGGICGVAIYLLCLYMGTSEILANFFAAVTMSLYAEIMARIRKYPAFSYLSIALLPLVPGAGVYYTVEHLLLGDKITSSSKAVQTAAIAGVLAVGVLLISSMFRMASELKRQKRDNK